MSDPFVGEIRMFAGNFAPRGYAMCDGQLLAVSQNDALFSLFGTIYGGDGRTTFGLPDLRGSIPIHVGSGPGLSPRQIGSKGGSETETLSVANLPSHEHSQQATSQDANTDDPSGALPAKAAGATYTSPDGNEVDMQASALTGEGQPHPNVQPFLCVLFIVALVGIYPSRN